MTVPGSKSETNRALILAAHSRGPVTLRGALWSDDTAVMVEALRTLGVRVRVEDDPAEASNRTLAVLGVDPIAAGGTVGQPLELFVGNAGTAARFLTAFVALGHGVYRLSGTGRMHERPQAALLKALRQLGYQVEASGDRLPVVVQGGGRRPGVCEVSIAESSQFASALLLSSRAGAWQVTVTDANADESPYVTMTEQMLAMFPASGEYAIEGDASSGSYFVGASLVARLRGEAAGSPVVVTNWPRSGWQFDQRFASFCDEVAAGRAPFEVSRATDLGDSIMTAIVLAPLFARPMRFVDLGRLRVQECASPDAVRGWRWRGTRCSCSRRRCGARRSERSTITASRCALRRSDSSCQGW
jgi:3-phosphoshikimate 1-carboxyvinyltransferase